SRRLPRGIGSALRKPEGVARALSRHLRVGLELRSSSPRTIRHMGESRGRIMTGLIRVAPHRGDHRVAIRSAVSLAVPLLVLGALGRVALSVYASFGAFASLYGRYDAYAERIRMQTAAGAVIVLSMAIGTGVSLLGAPVVL